MNLKKWIVFLFIVVVVFLPAEILAFEISFPQGGELWKGGGEYEIKWIDGSDTTELYYYDGSSWHLIEVVLYSDSYKWKASNDNTEAAKIKVVKVENSGETQSLESGNFTIDSTMPQVSIETSFEDEIFRGGDTIEIEWSADSAGVSGYDVFEVQYFDGDNWLLQDTVPGGEDSYNWTIPKDNNNGAVIRMYAHDGAGNTGVDTSAVFRIDSFLPEVDLVYPRGGEYIVNDTVIYDTVTWKIGDAGLSDYDTFIVKRRISPDTHWEQRQGDIKHISDTLVAFSDTFPGIDDEDYIEGQIKIIAIDEVGNLGVDTGAVFIIGPVLEIDIGSVTESLSGIPGDTTFSYDNYKTVHVEGSIAIEGAGEDLIDSGYFRLLLNGKEADYFGPDYFEHNVSFEQKADTGEINEVTLEIIAADTYGHKIVKKSRQYRVNLIRPEIELKWVEPEVDKELVKIEKDGEEFYRTNSPRLSVAGYVRYDDIKPGLFTLQQDTQVLNDVGGGTWSFGIDTGVFAELSPGENQVVLYAENLYENARTKSFTVIYDTKPSPILEITPSENKRYVSEPSIELSVSTDENARSVKFTNTDLPGEERIVFTENYGVYKTEINLSDTVDAQVIEIEVENNLGIVNSTEISVNYNPNTLFLESVRPDIVFTDFRISEDIFLDSYPVRTTLYNHSNDTMIFDETTDISLHYEYIVDSQIEKTGEASLSLDTEPAAIPPKFAGNVWFALGKPENFPDTGDIKFYLSYEGYDYNPVKRTVIAYDNILIEPEIVHVDTDVYRGEKFNLAGSVTNRSPRFSMQIDVFAVLFFRDHVIQDGSEVTDYFEVTELSDDIRRGVDSEGHDVAVIPYEIQPARDAPLGEVRLYFGAVLNITGLPFAIDVVTDTPIYVKDLSEEPLLENVYHYYSTNPGGGGPADPDDSNEISFCFEVSESRQVEITIYTLTGDRVWSTKKQANSGSNEIRWNGNNTVGRPVSSGGYIYHIEAGSASELGKIAIYRGR